MTTTDIGMINEMAWKIAAMSILKEGREYNCCTKSRIRNIALMASQVESRDQFLTVIKNIKNNYKPPLDATDKRTKEAYEKKYNKFIEWFNYTYKTIEESSLDDLKLLFKYVLWDINTLEGKNQNEDLLRAAFNAENISSPGEMLEALKSCGLDIKKAKPQKESSGVIDKKILTDLVGQVTTGRVKKWIDERGFGFITLDAGGNDIFVHFSGIKQKVYKSLTEGDKVRFRITKGDKGLKAIDVEVIN